MCIFYFTVMLALPLKQGKLSCSNDNVDNDICHIFYYDNFNNILFAVHMCRCTVNLAHFEKGGRKREYHWMQKKKLENGFTICNSTHILGIISYLQ